MFFPMFINLKNKKVLIAGAGKLGNRKARTLKEYGADITVYSEKIAEEEITGIEGIQIVNRNIENDGDRIYELVKNYYLVIAATDDTGLNDKIAEICMKNDILVNNVSSKTEMNAMFGAIVKNDEFHVAVSTSGKSCRRSKALKSTIQKFLNELEK